MQFLQDPNINFMGSRKLWLTVSAVVVSLSLFVLVVQKQLNIGVDFAGGTQLAVKFAGQPDLDQLRSALSSVDYGDATIQQIGGPEANEVMIKTRLRDAEEIAAEDADASAESGPDDVSSRPIVESAFSDLLNQDLAGRFDLNRIGSLDLEERLKASDPDGLRDDLDDIGYRDHYREAATSILAVRQSEGILASLSELEGTASAEVLSFLDQNAGVGAFTFLSADNVGPQIGKELRQRGVLAVVLSLLGMLAYIWWRFELRFGIGALAALSHDVIICLGLYALMGFEFNLTTIAAFLTVVGYSVNDSVVVFDRVRENLRRTRREPFFTVLNQSLNQTLSRTVLTSGTTLLAVTTLYIFGGEVIRGFAFVLVIGVIVGTYSSIFIASPITLFWEEWFGREARTRRVDGGGKKAAQKSASAAREQGAV